MNIARRMRNRGWKAAIAAIATVALAACSNAGTSGSSADTLKIGLLVEQTGQFSWYGQEVAQGAELYRRQHPTVGNRKIEFVTYDTGSDPQKAVTGFRKLVQQDEVAAVVGLGLTNEASVVAPLANSLKTPLYVLSGSFTPPNPQTFAMPVQIGDKAKTEFAELAQRGVKRIALLITNDATGQIARSLFPKLAADAGMTVVATEQMNTTDVDVSPQLTNIVRSGPDLIVAWEIGKPLGVVYNSAAQLAVPMPFMISDGNLAPGFLQSIAGQQPKTVYFQATKDVFWKDLPTSDPQSKIVTKFHNDYVAQMHAEPGLGSASGYDSVMLLATAAQKAGSVDRAKITQTLSGLDGIQGVFGIYHLSPSNRVGLAATDTMLGQVTSGQIGLAGSAS
jgi:branched-chain amino acid transport system substrate-binding protein